MRRYDQIPHTADIAARIYGRTIPELLENAAFAMFDMAGDLEGLALEEAVKVAVEAPDTESLLVSWLNELLYISYSRDALFSWFHVLTLEGNRLTAEAKGQRLKGETNRLRSEIKAATYHDLEIKRTGSGYEVTVVFDV
ncbi:MAG: archease [Candidatus Makaraimicrobium thalassicum]|nr:MAG: archease [Candidatus Omnitrophota bacterium]